MPKIPFEPCIPTRGTEVPAGPDWFHEIKHDGYRLIVQRGGKRVQLLSRRGYDWSDRHPPNQAALRLRKTSFVIDGEAVVLGPDEISDFDALHGGARNAEVRLYAVALLTDDGVDMRDETLEIRKRRQMLNRRRAAHVASPTTLRENVHPKDTSS